jgi:uncharacterized protein with HEPN domain
MTEQGKKYLSDIIQAVELIKSFTTGINDFEVYVSDLKTQSAVERQLGIIGEAVSKFEKLYPGITLANAHKIVGLRNKLIHSYDIIDPSIIWAIINNHLESLRQEVEENLL